MWGLKRDTGMDFTYLEFTWAVCAPGPDATHRLGPTVVLSW